MAARKNLRKFRIDHDLNQSEFCEKIGYDRKVLYFVENDIKEGSAKFWEAVRTTFGLNDKEIRELKKIAEN